MTSSGQTRKGSLWFNSDMCLLSIYEGLIRTHAPPCCLFTSYCHEKVLGWDFADLLESGPCTATLAVSSRSDSRRHWRCPACLAFESYMSVFHFYISTQRPVPWFQSSQKEEDEIFTNGNSMLWTQGAQLLSHSALKRSRVGRAGSVGQTASCNQWFNTFRSRCRDLLR